MKRINWNRKLRAFVKVRADILDYYANSYENHFRKAFRDGGFTDKNLDVWAQRKAKEKGGKRAILVKSGNLRNSITTKRYGGNKRGVGSYSVTYATYHNKGSKIHPIRQFIGLSEVVRRKCKPETLRIFRHGLRS